MLLCHNVLGLVFIWSHFLVFLLRKEVKKCKWKAKSTRFTHESGCHLPKCLPECFYLWLTFKTSQMEQHNGNVGTTLSFFYTNAETYEHTRDLWVWYFDPVEAQLGINKHPFVLTFFLRTSLGSLVIILTIILYIYNVRHPKWYLCPGHSIHLFLY